MHIIEDKPEIWPYLLASVLLHLLLAASIPFVVASAPKFKEEPIEVFAVSDLPSKRDTAYRIADIDEPAKQERPDSAKFLGMYDSKVPEEMVGLNMKPGKRVDGSARHASPLAGEAGGGAASKRTLVKKGDLFAFNKDIFSEGKGSARGENAVPKSSAGMDDFYPDFRRGGQTYLNVLRYPEVAYFVRLKRAFKIAFDPVPALREYFARNLITRGSIDVVLGVSVGNTGELTELFVFRSSGVASYDEEALRTVKVSAPFASPPEKFLANDGTLKMSWTFSVYL